MGTIVLPNGTVIQANEGIIGLDANGEIFEGYDASLEAFQPLTAEDRALLAAEMIKRWQTVRAAALDELGKPDGDGT